MVIVFCRKKVCFRSLYTDSEVLSSFEWGGGRRQTEWEGLTEKIKRECVCVSEKETEEITNIRDWYVRKQP